MNRIAARRTVAKRFRRMAVLLVAACALPAGAPVAADVDPSLRERARSAPMVDVLVRLEPARLPERRVGEPFARRNAAVGAALAAHARSSQRALLREFERRGIAHRPFWIANAIHARVDAAQLDWLARRQDVDAVVPDHPLHAEPVLQSPAPAAAKATQAIEWGVVRVRAPDAWALGYTGQGVVIGGQDTGYDWSHPALLTAYRGWDGSSATHHHHWYDAVRSGGDNPCGHASPMPCDDDNHGTHTMGTMVGDDGGSNRIGVAPGARWIGCRNMDRGIGTVSTYLGCFEWFLAPTDLDGANPSPQLAPHVINNSWACPPSEGCTDLEVLAEAVANTHAAGIFVVVSAGNAGPGCGTVNLPPAVHAASFAVAASTASDAIASFSSRGPVLVDGSRRLKPDVAAPGTQIRSALRFGGYGSLSGTSMASPHVAGVAALMMSANPRLIGDPDRVAALLRSTATPSLSAQDCEGLPGGAVPNAVFGHGRVDALAAVQAALADLFRDGFETH